jgi:DNA polymerase III subunit delta'
MPIDVATPLAMGNWPVWGHQATVDELVAAVASDRVRHAWLISGPEGIGKRAVAGAFASALLCQSPPAPGWICGACLSCRKVARGVHPDVQLFGIAAQTAAASKSSGKNTTLTIETVRALTATAALRPLEGRWRISIVDDAEALQETAQEALLKTLEEPPPFTIILLLANDAGALLPTVRSRCQHVELGAVTRATIQAGLESRGVPPARAAEVAGAAAGAPGWAVRAAAEPKLVKERLEAIGRAVTWIGAAPFERVATAFRLGDSFTKRRAAVFSEMQLLLGLWRDAMLLRAQLSSAVTFPAVSTQLETAVSAWSLATVHASLLSVRQCIADLEANVRPRLAMESMVLQWPTT